MTSDEKKALSLCRYANWLTNIRGQVEVVTRLQSQLHDANLQLAYAILEAREERECLTAMGVHQDRIAALGQIPETPFTLASIIGEPTGPG